MSIIADQLPTKNEFAASIDTLFHAQTADGSGFELCLVGFEDLVSNSVQENYALLFRAPVDAPQVQSIYRLEHGKLGAMDIFLVPVKKDEDGLYFEAVFNLLKQAAA